MDIVILCGGRGTRLSEMTKETPKPLVEIGDSPILWHIMKIFDHYGYKRFLLALGYKGDLIKKWFLDYRIRGSFELDFDNVNLPEHVEKWKVLFKNTGEDSGTGYRLKQLKDHIKSKTFIMTYGDGVADVDINALVKHHEKMVKEKGVLLTASSIQTRFQYGVFNLKDDHLVSSFEEKPKLDKWINIGFIVCERQVLDLIPDDPEVMFEKDVISKIAAMNKMAIYKHKGVFHSMDTFRDYSHLNELWKSGKAEWRIWKPHDDEI